MERSGADTAGPLLVPEGSRLVHIGPHKTGTTAIQAALHDQREALTDHGVTVLGRSRHEAGAAGWVAEHPLPFVTEVTARRQWEALCAQARAEAYRRAVISSEYFSDAPSHAARRIVDDLGPGVHVTVTLRPLSAILPSQWQQYVLRGLRTPYPDWLQATLRPGGKHGGKGNDSFWVRHRHDELVRRWTDLVGTERVTVLVLGPDRDLLPRTFEELLGLPAGMLRPPASHSNRSMTYPEAEAVRAYQRLRRSERKRSTPAVEAWIARHGVGPILKQRVPGPDEPAVAGPRWAMERAAEIGAEMAAEIARSGVRVVGDLSTLASADGVTADAAPVEVPVDVAGRLALGVATGWASMPSAPSPERTVQTIPTGTLVSELVRRVRRRTGPERLGAVVSRLRSAMSPGRDRPLE